MPEYTPTELARIELSDQIRRLSHELMRNDIDVDVLRDVAARLSSDADRLAAAEPLPTKFSSFQRYGTSEPPADGEEFPNSLDRPVSGSGTPFSIPLTVIRSGDRAVTEVVLDKGYEGAPERAHGGYVAAIFDDLLGFLLSLNQTMAFTASLTVSYHEGTPIGVPLTFAAWIDRIEGRKLYLAADCHDPEGTRVTSCEGLFIDMTEQFEAMRAERV